MINFPFSESTVLFLFAVLENSVLASPKKLFIMSGQQYWKRKNRNLIYPLKKETSKNNCIFRTKARPCKTTLGKYLGKYSPKGFYTYTPNNNKHLYLNKQQQKFIKEKLKPEIGYWPNYFFPFNLSFWIY